MVQEFVHSPQSQLITGEPECINLMKLPQPWPQLVGAASRKLKGCEFKCWSGHLSRLRVQSPVGVHMRGNLLRFLSHIDVSLPLSLPPSLCKISSVSSGVDKRKATVMKYHILGGLNNRNVLFHYTGGKESKMQVLARLVPNPIGLGSLY